MVTDNVIQCSKKMTISNATAFHLELENALELGSNVTINAELIEMIDTACLQMCLAFRKELQKNDLDVIWKNPTEIMIENAKRIGLASELGLTA